MSVLLGHVAEGLNRGERFYVPLKHTVLTGMTEYGKTTALETLAYNMPSNVKVLVFLTKRGEKRFHSTDIHFVPPFFKPRYDWLYVRTLLESTMHEKLRFETPWIYRVCKQAKIEIKRQNLPEEEGIFMVRTLLGRMETDEKARDFDKNINTTLLAYMDQFLPVLKENQKTFTKTIDLKSGINVMDLSSWYTNDVIQMVVIRACMEEILDHGDNTIIGLPESWKVLPQGRNTPVKLLFERFIREGATNKNYLYIDAQDLGGVDKVHLRQCDVWIMGHMKQEDEVKRILKQTLGVDIKASEVQTLPRGHFLVAAEDKVTKVYVWPHGISEEISVKVAKGEISSELVKTMLDTLQKQAKEYVPVEEEPYAAHMQETTAQDALEKRVEALSLRLDTHIKETAINPMQLPSMPPNLVNSEATGALQIVKKNLKVEAVTMNFKLTTEDAAGKIMYLAKEGYLNTWRSQSEVEKTLIAKHGWTIPRITIYKAIEKLVNDGFLGKQKTDRQVYKIAEFVTFEE